MRVDDSTTLSCEPEHGCITCADEALPLRVVEVDRDRDLALCTSAKGERSTVEIALVGPIEPGDCILVHAGTAIARAPEGAMA